MLARSLLDLHTSLTGEDTVLVYHGYLSDTLLGALGSVAKRRLEQEGVDARRIRDLFAVFVEQAQNIIRYSTERSATGDAELAYGIVMIGREGDRYVVASANPMAPAAVERLRERLTELVALDAEALRAYYKRRLRQPAEADSKGAGVGFVEMARRAADGLQFEFFQHDGGTAYFAVRVAL